MLTDQEESFIKVVREAMLQNTTSILRGLVKIGDDIHNTGAKLEHYKLCLEYMKTGDKTLFGTRLLYRRKPVSITKFLLHDYYLGLEGQVYPKIMEHLIEINSGNYYETVLTGAIGTAKTTIAIWSTAYQLYLLSCMGSPQSTYGLEEASEIEFVFQSKNASLAKGVNYARFLALIQRSPYFNENFKYDVNITSELRFPNRILVKPVSGSQDAAIGQNVIGGIIDEMNFMEKTQKSKNSVDGGEYDQALAIYNSLSRRRKTRFMCKGKVAGILHLVSSKRYPNQFTDIKEQEANREIQETGKTHIYIYDKRTWEVLPIEDFTGEWFKVFIGDLTRKPYIIDPDADYSHLEKELVMDIPLEYLNEFRQDMGDALRDIAGVSTLATIPFMPNLENIAKAFTNDLESIFSTDICDFVLRKVALLPSVIKKCDKNFPRFAHVDLGLTADNAGVVIGHVPEFVPINQDGNTAYMPKIVIDGTLRIAPPLNGEINFEKIRKIFYVLQKLGFPLKWITFDSYQSVDSMQLLRQNGFATGRQSMDLTTVPYDMTKTAINQGRIIIPANPHLQTELARLERTPNGKIDHPVNFSKDIADSLAGVVHGLTMQSCTWAQFGHSPVGLLEDLHDLTSASASKATH